MDLIESGKRFQNRIPIFRPLYINLPAIPPEVLESEGGFFGWVIRLVQARSRKPGRFRRLLARLVRHLESMPREEQSRWIEFLSYLHGLIYNARDPAEQSSLQWEIESSVATKGHRQEVHFMGRTIADALKEEGRLENARTTLIRLLKRRFGEVPEESVGIIQATSDLERLNHWLDLVVSAATLEEIGIGS